MRIRICATESTACNSRYLAWIGRASKRTRKLLSVLLLLPLCLTAQQANSQTASYTFDGNLSDSAASFNAGSSGAVAYLNEGDRSFVNLGADGVVTLPASLSAELFANESFDISFDFRVNGSASLPQYQILFSAKTAWLNDFDPGIALAIHSELYGSQLILTYSDGQGSEASPWLEFSGLITRGQWHSITMVFDLANDYWQFTFDGRVTSGSFPAAFDKETFQAAIENLEITLGGLNGNKHQSYVAPFDIDEFRAFGPARSYVDEVNTAFEALTDDLNAVTSLSEVEKAGHLETLQQNLYTQDYALIADSLFAYTHAYEAINPPLYQDGREYLFDDLPIHGRLLQFSQSYVFQTQFVSGNAENVAGIVFEHSEVAPGSVDPATPRIATTSVELNGSYHREVAAELTDQSRVVRPTGYYLAAGDIVTIDVPAAVIDQGLSVIVGAHFRNMDYDYVGAINRYADISVEYPLDATQIQIANPFGGGIYLKVPEATSAGFFNMTIENAIKSPYFSWRAGRETDVGDWLNQVLHSGAPWADFESDKFMFTLPTSELAGIYNPDQIMARWDEIMDAIRLVAGRSATRPRAEYYSFDTRLVTPAYGAGYPLVIPIWEAFRSADDGWNPLTVLDVRPHVILLHEMGHNALHPTLGYGGGLDQCHFLEAESINHMLAMSIFSNVYGLSNEEAFAYSGTGRSSGFSFDAAAFDWIITSNFRNNLRMYYDDTAPMEDGNMMHYQPRSWAKYGDIARLFGWDGIASVNGKFYTPGVEQTSTVCNSRGFVVGRDEYIREASDSLGVNMTPLFHFWGINPSPELVLELQSYPESEAIYDLIKHYQDNVAPKTIADYQVFHDELYDPEDYQQPRYDEYIIQFDNDFADAIDSQFEFLLDTYFPSYALDDSTEDEWPAQYNGVIPPTNLAIELNNIGVFNSEDQIIYSCLRVFTNGLQSSVDGVERFDVGFEIVSPEEGIIGVNKARPFNANNVLNENSEVPDCSGIFENTTGVYTDKIQVDDQFLDVVFELTDAPTLQFTLVSADEIVAVQ